MPFISARGPDDSAILPLDPAQVVFIQSFPTLAQAMAGKERLDPTNPAGTKVIIFGNKFEKGQILLCPLDSWDENFKARFFDLFRVPTALAEADRDKQIVGIVNGFGQGGEPVSVGR